MPTMNTLSPSAPRTARRWPRRLAYLAWASWAVSLALLWVQEWLGVVHLAGWLFVLLVALTVLAGLVGLVWGVVLAVRRISRLAAWWGLVALGPILLWLCLSLHTLAQEAQA